MTDRCLPGEGDIDFAALFSVLDVIGAAPVIAPEVFSKTLAMLGMEAMANHYLARRGELFEHGRLAVLGCACGVPGRG